MTFLATVDRIEGSFAVLLPAEGGDRIVMPSSLLPEGAGEGVLVEVRIKVHDEETRKARERVRSLIDQLLGPRTPGGSGPGGGEGEEGPGA